MTALEAAGYPTYIVGGAVRDTIMKNPIKDLDVTTLATPSQVEEVVQSLKGFEYITGGEAAVSISNLISLVNFPDHKKGTPHDIEIATFRTDVGFERDEDGNRDRTRPILAPASTLREDLKRRDFTINAIAMDKSFRIIDPLGGMEDIKAGIVRAVGKPSLRFAEDPVRMIRAVRFSTRYDFTMDPATREAIVDNISWIERISAPRMRDEMGKVLMQKGGFQELYALGVIPLLMPELRNIKDLEHNPAYHPEGSVFGHYCAMFDRLGDAVREYPPQFTSHNSATEPPVAEPPTLSHGLYCFTTSERSPQRKRPPRAISSPSTRTRAWAQVSLVKTMGQEVLHLLTSSAVKNRKPLLGPPYSILESFGIVRSLGKFGRWS